MKRVYLIDDNVKFIISEQCLINTSNGSKEKLRSSAAFCLLLLLESHGRLVSHNELYEFGWERFGMTASLNVLHNTIFYLRKMLNKAGGYDSGIIETIHRRGFIFNPKVNVKLAEISIPEDNDISFDMESNEGEFDGIINQVDSEFNEKSKHELENFNLNDESNITSISDGYLNTNSLNEVQHGETSLENECIDRYKISLKETNERKINEETNNVEKKGRARHITLIRVLSIGTLLITFSIFLIGVIGKVLNPIDYIYSGKLGQCNIYQNSSAYEFKLTSQMDYFINACKTPRVLYVTKYPYANNLSVISCLNKVTIFSNDVCLSNYFILRNSDY